MDERIEKWLYDIRFAIEEIETFLKAAGRTFADFRKNLMFKRATERNLEIIGEATKRILSKDATIEIENARQIVNLRNYVIHSYDSVSEEQIWAIVINDLPKLKKEINRLIPPQYKQQNSITE